MADHMNDSRDRSWSGVISPHGGYRALKSYQNGEIIHDATVAFCGRLIDRRSRTHNQMVQAARSGKQTEREARRWAAPPCAAPKRMRRVAEAGRPLGGFRHNIAEGSMASGTSTKTELKLVAVARASLEELLLDYEDYLRQRGLALWNKDHPRSQEVRALAYESNRSYETYRTSIERSSPEVAANAMICLIHQTNYLLDQQLRQLDERFRREGGFTERLYRVRGEARGNRPSGR